MTFLDLWIGYAIFGTTVVSAVFVWAVRARQFTEFDRARRIGLDAEGPKPEEEESKPGRLDRYTWVGLAVLTAGVVGMALWVGYGGR